MRDWEALVEQHLIGLSLEPTERAEVIAELAAHLEESCEELRRQGMPEERAVRQTLSEVEDWQNLRRRIQTARTKESMMTNRVKQLWVPSLLTLLLSMGLLALIQIFGPKPWLFGWDGKSRWTFVAPALLGLFLAGASGDGHLQRSPRPQHHVRCLVRWLIWVGSGPRGGASCRWTAGTVLSFTTAGFPESCRQLIETGSSGDKREAPRA